MFYDAFYVAGLALAKMHTWQLRCNDSTFHNAVCSLNSVPYRLRVLSFQPDCVQLRSTSFGENMWQVRSSRADFSYSVFTRGLIAVRRSW